MKFEGNIDLNKFQILNPVAQNLASAPGTPSNGQWYYDTSLTQFGFRQNGAWVYLSAVDLTNYLSAASAATETGQMWVSAGSSRASQIFTATAGTILKIAADNKVAGAVAGTDYVTEDSTNSFTNKTFNANGTGNSLSNVEVADFAATAIVTEVEGLNSSDNDTSIPTTAAVKDYVDSLSSLSKYSASVGNGSDAAIVVTHSLGTKDVTVSTRYVSNDEAFIVDWTATSTTQITLNFGTAPAASSVRVVVMG